MSISPCLLIPIYNHKESISATIDRLVLYGLPIFVVDDGSDPATQQVLASLAVAHPLIRLERLAENGGKGAAVMHGMRTAYRAGFSHALQIDADGQHDTMDVQRFLDRGKAAPGAIICGQPTYDQSVPKSRLYSRYITHIWVWIETLSFTIADSMCGFRLYPLAATCQLIDRVRLPTRMDFDIEILVRLVWDGVPVENIPTRVIYPKGGVSHFQIWGDNVRITKMHTRLFFGMLSRLLILLWRKVRAGARNQTHWSQIVERGSGFGLRIVFLCYRVLGARMTSLLLYPIVTYFFLTSARARSASKDYLCRVAEHTGRPHPGWRDTFRHLLAFAQAGLDKLAAWMGEIDHTKVDFPNRAALDGIIQSGRGALLIGSHLGNLEMTRALATRSELAVVNAVVYTDHAQQFNRILASANANFGVNLLQVSSFGPDTAIMLKQKIDQGELLVIVGDRTPPAENGRISMVKFIDAPAPFAQGPFILASLLDCPVFLFFCLREKDGYRIYLEPFAERITLPRRERQRYLQDYIQQYACRLEAKCMQVPEQWFNFFDFWQSDAITPDGQ